MQPPHLYVCLGMKVVAVLVMLLPVLLVVRVQSGGEGNSGGQEDKETDGLSSESNT